MGTTQLNTMTTTQSIRDFILEELLPGENADDLEDSTDLVSSGILDSLATLKLVSFLEGEFGVTIKPSETTPEQLRTIQMISNLVQSKC